MISNLGLLEIGLFFGGALLAVVQWFLKKWVASLEESIKHLQKNQSDLDKELHVIKESYATKVDIREIKEEIVDRLIRIENYLLDKK
jgi:hypothetical protein